MSSVPQPKSLVIDLEVAPGKEGHPDRIFKIGAARPDLGVELDRKVSKNLPEILAEVDKLSDGAGFLLGTSKNPILT